MNVLHVCNSAGGGAALSTLGLIDRLRDVGVTSSIVCHEAGSTGERKDLAEAVDGRILFTPLYWWNKKIRSSLWKRPLIEIRQLIRTGGTRRSTRIVAEFARSQRTNILHSNTILTLEGAYAAKALNLPHVWHLRELVGPGEPFSFRREGHVWGRYVASYCNALIANSETTAAKVRDFLPSELLHTIPNGIDLSKFSMIEARNDRKTLVVGMVASLSSRVKNHEQFIRAASLVNKDLPVEFRIYGSDPSNGGVNRRDTYACSLHDLAASLGLHSRLRWQGFNNRPEQIMSEIDILVHPAYQESFGRVVVEAMAAGLPVVGVRGGGVAEIVVDGLTGWLLNPGDAAGIARKIEQLVQNGDLRQELGHAGRMRAETEYSLDNCAHRVAQVYESVLGQRTLASPSHLFSQPNPAA